ncbi:unnamed protein product [Paramecium sonneborni]|uniref:RING-type domain-containing protein n=1 Tax=Paramecium sonneborni TaxID=65129 RepID=A0A8S1Q5S0_9CILI|nr:unnamed protein product [Paramecium sonneborni]
MIKVKLHNQTNLMVITSVITRREEQGSQKLKQMVNKYSFQHILIIIEGIIIQLYGVAKQSIVIIIAQIMGNAQQIQILQNIDGCVCYSGYVGSDCHQAALEIQNEYESISFYRDEIKFFYLKINKQEDMDIQLNLQSDSFQGLEVIMQLTNAIIIPTQIPFFGEEILIKKYKIYESQPQKVIIRYKGSNQLDRETYQQIVFVAKQLNENLTVLASTLTIHYQEFEYQESTVSIVVIIIIVVAISAAVIIIMILFFVCKSIRKKKMLRTQARLRMARLDAQSPNQNGLYQDQENLFDLLTPIQFTDLTNQDNCAICLDNLNNGQEVRQTHCHHNFHSKCIKEWFSKNKKECPVCRTNLANKDLQANIIPNK